MLWCLLQILYCKSLKLILYNVYNCCCYWNIRKVTFLMSPATRPSSVTSLLLSFIPARNCYKLFSNLFISHQRRAQQLTLIYYDTHITYNLSCSYFCCCLSGILFIWYLFYVCMIMVLHKMYSWSKQSRIYYSLIYFADMQIILRTKTMLKPINNPKLSSNITYSIEHEANNTYVNYLFLIHSWIQVYVCMYRNRRKLI